MTTTTTMTCTERFTAETAAVTDFSSLAPAPMTEESFVRGAANLLRSFNTPYAFERAAAFEKAGLARAARNTIRDTATRW